MAQLLSLSVLESETMESGPVLRAGGKGMARDEGLTGASTASDSGTWFADYSARFAKTAEETARVGAAVADRWARRSLTDSEWTVDTVTADAIADWDEMTPLMGRWLDLWLEALQQPIGGAKRREG